MQRGTKGGQAKRIEAATQDLQAEVFGEQATPAPAKSGRAPAQKPWRAWNGDIRMPVAQGRIENVACTYLSQMRSGMYGPLSPGDPVQIAASCPGLSA